MVAQGLSSLESKMSVYTGDADVAFHGSGSKIGTEIWCIENQCLVSIPKSSYGRFFSGSAYLVLNTVLLKDGMPRHDIHYWIGDEANEVDSFLVSDKSLELDMVLGSCTVQYRELQGQESAKFLSYFKPCVIPCEGVYTSGPGRSISGKYNISLLACKGEHAVSVKEVPFSRSSLNHDDVFILDTASKIYLFCGHNSSVQERAKALEVVKYIKEEKHGGNCLVAALEDGKFVSDSDSGEFWSLFGGYAPIPRDSSSFFKKQLDSPVVKLFWINTQGNLCETANGEFSRDMLARDKCYLLDCGREVYVWMGRSTSVTERKRSISTTEDSLRSQNRASTSLVTVLAEGSETLEFKSYFIGWNLVDNLNLYEEGKGKVAAMFKHQGFDVKELPEEEWQPLIDCGGQLKIWMVDGDELYSVPFDNVVNLLSGGCYIIQYTYPGSEREESIFFTWFGSASVEEDRINGISHMADMAKSSKGAPILARIFEGEEPEEFFWIIHRLIVLKEGISIRNETSLAEKGFVTGSDGSLALALFRVQGTSPENMQAVQVNVDASSMNSSYCYIFQTEATVFTWRGKLTLSRDHDILDKMLELLDPSCQSKLLREGGESDEFWTSLGGREDYPSERKIRKHTEDPRLFVCNCSEDDFKVKEIFSFTQDDLTTEDVFILDCCREIYVWVGCHSNVQSNLQALRFGLKYVEANTWDQGRSLNTPLYVVSERHEPDLFTRFFDWDISKSNMYGSSFERKLAILRGEKEKLEAQARDSWRAHSPSSIPKGPRIKSVYTNGTRESVSALSSRAGSQPVSPTAPREFNSSLPIQNISALLVNKDEDDANLVVYAYERLKVASDDPVSGIDVSKREAYLSTEEFKEKFGMTKRAFYDLPIWKQNKLKMLVNLF